MERNKLRSVTKTYSNDRIEVVWRNELCCHSTVCLRRLPEVFRLNETPWIDIDGASPEKIAETVALCPTRALTCKLK